jgi:HSP20 family molecular chaperone IbpA
MAKAAKQQEDSFDSMQNFHQKIWSHHLAMQKEMDEMFEAQRKYMEKVFQQNGLFGTNSILIVNDEKDKCTFIIKNETKNKKLPDDLQIKVEDGILVVFLNSHNTSIKAADHVKQFYYAFTIPEYCKVEPSIKKAEGEISISMPLKTSK